MFHHNGKEELHVQDESPDSRRSSGDDSLIMPAVPPNTSEDEEAGSGNEEGSCHMSNDSEEEGGGDEGDNDGDDEGGGDNEKDNEEEGQEENTNLFLKYRNHSSTSSDATGHSGGEERRDHYRNNSSNSNSSSNSSSANSSRLDMKLKNEAMMFTRCDSVETAAASSDESEDEEEEQVGHGQRSGAFNSDSYRHFNNVDYVTWKPIKSTNTTSSCSMNGQTNLYGYKSVSNAASNSGTCSSSYSSGEGLMGDVLVDGIALQKSSSLNKLELESIGGLLALSSMDNKH